MVIAETKSDDLDAIVENSLKKSCTMGMKLKIDLQEPGTSLSGGQQQRSVYSKSNFC